MKQRSAAAAIKFKPARREGQPGIPGSRANEFRLAY